MQFKGRTVILLILLSAIVSSVVTYRFSNDILSYLSIDYGVKNSISESSPPDATPQVQTTLSKQDLAKLKTVYELIAKRFVQPVEHDKLMTGAINGMVNALEDPYSTYMNVTEAKQFQENITSSFSGIGTEVTIQDGNLTVVSPIKNSPAEKAGIQANDIIVSVDGEKIEGLSIGQAVLKIRGPKGSEVKLEILRKGVSKPIFITVIRDDIDVETVYAEMLDNQIGKIEIRQFSIHTADRFKEELQNLENSGLKGLIIDVRNNPGGLLNSVEQIAELFIPEGKVIVQIEDRFGNKDSNYSNGTAKNYPVTVLINNGSASASEILAGALHDTVQAKLIGEKTFGKGTVQTTFENELGDGSNLKLTGFKWLTPNGDWIHKKGISPDIAVEQPEYFKISAINKETTLRVNTISEDTKTVQIILKALGYSVDREDGYFSEMTNQAVLDFQKNQGLSSTGEVDTSTANKLEQEIILKIRDPKNDTQLQTAVDTILKEIKP